MIQRIREILDIKDDSQDSILTWMLQDATQAVLDYCHIKELPLALESFVIGMVVREYNQLSEGTIASIKRGDTTIQYQNDISANGFTDKQKSRLNAYRRLQRR